MPNNETSLRQPTTLKFSHFLLHVNFKNYHSECVKIVFPIDFACKFMVVEDCFIGRGKARSHVLLEWLVSSIKLDQDALIRHAF